MATRRNPYRYVRGFVVAGILMAGLFAGLMQGSLRQAAQDPKTDPSPNLCELPAPMQSFY
jgi:hypothetical protein